MACNRIFIRCGACGGDAMLAKGLSSYATMDTVETDLDSFFDEHAWCAQEPGDGEYSGGLPIHFSLTYEHADPDESRDAGRLRLKLEEWVAHKPETGEPRFDGPAIEEAARLAARADAAREILAILDGPIVQEQTESVSLTVPLALQAKLGAAVVHGLELAQCLDKRASDFTFDLEALRTVIEDPDVKAWVRSLGPLAPVPRDLRLLEQAEDVGDG